MPDLTARETPPESTAWKQLLETQRREYQKT